MKKLRIVLLAAVIALGLTACTKEDSPPHSAATVSSSASTTASVHTHTYTEAVTAPTCREGGCTTYTCSCGHSYRDLETPATGHSWGDWITTTEPTETAEGEAQRSCTACDARESKPLVSLSHTHSYQEDITTPTCTREGYTTFTCACGHSYQGNPVGMVPHSWSDWQILTQATCQQDGLRKHSCQVCSATEEITVPSSGMHNYLENGTCADCAQVLQIPVLYFEGDITNMTSKADVRSIFVTYCTKGSKTEAFASLKVQGTSSLRYDKKNYTIQFFSDSEHSSKLPLDVGWGGQSKYCLKANWIDNTHARNLVTAKLVTEIQRKYGVLPQAPCNGAVDGFPVEIYSNGEFLGLYTFNIPKDTWQFAMDKDNPNHIVVCGDAWTPTNFFQESPNLWAWSVEVGPENGETLAKLSTLFDFVMNTPDTQFKEQFDQHLDLDATMHYYLVTELASLYDNHGKNMLLATYDGQKWYPSLYDLDSSWGMHYNGWSQWPQEFPINRNNLFLRLEQNYSQELANRYFELRDCGIFTKEHIMGLFNQFRAQIPQETFQKELDRWGPSIPGLSYGQIEQHVDTMLARMDAKYGAILASE